MLNLVKLLIVIYMTNCFLIPNLFSGSSLVAYWDMNEISDGNIIVDKSGNNNHAYIKGILGSLPLADGKIGNSLFFDGIGEGYLLVPPSASLNNLTEFTILGYVKYIDLYSFDGNKGNYPTFINRNVDNEDPAFWLFPGFMETAAWSYGKLACRTGKKGVWVASEEKLKWEKKQWYYIAASFNKDGVMTLYRDGQEIGRQQFPRDYNFGDKNIFIGSYQGQKSVWTMKGYIDEVKIFNSALSSNEILNLCKTDRFRTIPRLSIPALDGSAKEEFWKQCAAIDSFKTPGNNSIKKNTQAYSCRDNANLYIAFKCFDDNIKGIKANLNNHDDPIWQDDCVELFIDSGLGNNTYYQFLVNSKGVKTEGLSSAQDFSMNWGWNTEWTVNTKTFGNYWVAEIMIPLKNFIHSSDNNGEELKISLNREATELKEMTGWPSGYFHNPSEFGIFILGSYNDNLLKLLGQMNISLKQYEHEIYNFPPADEKEKINQALKNLSEKVNNCISMISSSDITTLTQWEEKKIEIRILEAQKKEINNKVMLYSLNQARGDLDKLKFAIGKIDLDLLAKSVDLQTDAYAAETFRTLVKSLYGYDFFVYKKSPWAGWEDDSISISPLKEQPLQNVELTMGINGYETVSLVLANFDNKSSKFTVKHENNDIKVTIRTSHFIPTLIGRNVSDPLPLLENPIEIAALHSKEIWLTVNTDKTKPGNYKIPISITSHENKTMTVELIVKIVPVEIPKQSKNMPFYTWAWDYINGMSPEIQQEAKNDLLAHYITVPFFSPGAIPWPADNGTVDYKKCDDSLKLWADSAPKMIGWYWHFSGNKKRFGNNFMDAQWKDNFVKWYTGFISHLKEKGLGTDDYFFHVFDETTSQELKELAGFLKQIDPKVKLFVNPAIRFHTDEIEAFNSCCDIWCPYFYGLMKTSNKQDLIDIMKTKGKFFWSYFNCEGGVPQCSSSYTSYRLIPWLAWKNKIQGMGNWVYLYHPDPSWTGAKAGRSYSWDMVYLSKYAPAGISKRENIIPSKRWEAWREGAEDFLLLSILKDALDEAETDNADSASLRQAKKCLEKWPDIVLENKKNVTLADKARQDIINNIINLQMEFKKTKIKK